MIITLTQNGVYTRSTRRYVVDECRRKCEHPVVTRWPHHYAATYLGLTDHADLT